MASDLRICIDRRWRCSTVLRTFCGLVGAARRVNSLPSPVGACLSRLTDLKHLRGSEAVDYAAYTLDDDGNRTSLRTPNGTETYTFNAIDQLTSATVPGGSTTTYTYDAA